MTGVLLAITDDERARRVENLLQEQVPSLRVTHARSMAAARHVLNVESLDMVVADETFEDGAYSDILNLIRAARQSIPVVVQVTSTSEEAERILYEHPELLDCAVRKPDDAHLLRAPVRFLQAIDRLKRSVEGPSEKGTADLLSQIRMGISRINHDVNNPLSIISGNAQLLTELARALELDDELAQPIRDIEEASGRVGVILRRLVELKEKLPLERAGAGDVRAELRAMQAAREET